MTTSLRTIYLGLELASPLVASAGPLSQTVAGVQALVDGGAAAVVLPSLFEEQLIAEATRDAMLEEMYAETSAESMTFFPNVPDIDNGRPIAYLDLLERAASTAGVPIIASLNGASTGGWTSFARQLADAGAAALELNIYFVPGDLSTSGADVEQRHVDIVTAVKQAVTIPVAVKLSPYFSSPGQVFRRLDAVGADGLVLFNRFLPPEVDIELLDVVPDVELSNPLEGRLPRTWIAALHGRVQASLAATSGVSAPADVIRYLLAGADVVMTTSALVRNGPSYASVLLDGLSDWMQRKGYRSVNEFRGLLALPDDVDANAFERAGYVAALRSAQQRYGSLV